MKIGKGRRQRDSSQKHRSRGQLRNSPSRRASRSRGSSRVAAGIIASGAPPMPLNPSTPCHMWLVPTPDLLTLSTSQHSCTGVIRSCSPMMQRVSAFTPARRSITSNRRTAWARRLWVAARILVKNPVDAYIHASASCKRCSKGSGVRLGLRIVTKAINMLGLVRTECGQSLPVRSVLRLYVAKQRRTVEGVT